MLTREDLGRRGFALLAGVSREISRQTTALGRGPGDRGTVLLRGDGVVQWEPSKLFAGSTTARRAATRACPGSAMSRT